MSKNKNKLLVIILCLSLIFSLVGCSSSQKQTNTNIESSIGSSYNETTDTIIVHYLDVGQGDCIFIELPNKEVMLIDAGESKSKNKIVNYIKTLGYQNIDYVVATHPHADHIGSMNTILNKFTIENIYLPNKMHNTKMFKTMFNTIINQEIPVEFVSLGSKILEQYDLSITVLSPIAENYANLNNYSTIIKIDYGESEFLFTGDAETLVENELLFNQVDIDSEILKVGHHGSNTSSSEDFIEAVSPEIAVISCGINNKYNHPNKETLETLRKQRAEIYRTDEVGTIIIEADKEENFKVLTEK